jgi:hypothetical protein
MKVSSGLNAVDAGKRLEPRWQCSGRRLSSRRLQRLQAVLTSLSQQAARRLRAAADRGR